jgi:hypothetical protein
MRLILACVLMAIAPAWAQAPAPSPQGAVPDKGACADCGVVRSVRRVKREIRPDAATESKPSGLVAQIPLGGGKPKVGSSAKMGADTVATSESWEITVRLDDGRFRLIVADKPPDLREGDKVRIEPNGQLKLRD